MLIHSKNITFRNLNFVTKNNLGGIRMGIGPIWEIRFLTSSSSLGVVYLLYGRPLFSPVQCFEFSGVYCFANSASST